MNRHLILGLLAGMGVLGMGMLPVITATLNKQDVGEHMSKDAQPHADESAPCSPSPSASPGT